MKFSLLLIIILTFILGCDQVWEFQKRIEVVKATPKIESFKAALFEDTIINEKFIQKAFLIEIDSNGSLRKTTDTLLGLWNSLQINDSMVLYDSYHDTSINYFNSNTRLFKKLLYGFGSFILTNDKNYLSFRGKVYKLTSDSLFFFAENTHYTIDFSFGDNMFGGRKADLPRKDIFYIFRPDFSIYDSIPGSRIYFGQMSGHYLKNEKEIFLSSAMAVTNFINVVAKYNIDSRRIDTLFSGRYFSHVIPLVDSNFYLLQGVTRSELEDVWDRQERERRSYQRKHPKGELYFGWPDGYWMLGNSRTKKIKKIGYEDFLTTVSSSGRHILFYKNDGVSYEVKVVSVKELVEGM